MKENEIQSKLFGLTKKIPCKGGQVVDVEELLKPLEWEEGIIRSFCQGCGYILEVNKKVAEELVKSANAELPDSLNDLYFETKSCTLCDGTDLSVQLKRIPQH